MVQEKSCRWGIMGTAFIARKVWKAIRNSGNGTLNAVASRDLEQCRRFIGQCQSEAPFDPTPRAFGSYEALLESDEIDAVYIPLPTGVRKEWVIRAAQAGKHVLSEKPAGKSAADVAAMIEACRKHKVQFMDGVMFMHSERLDTMRHVLEDTTSIGPIRRITSQFSFRAPEEFFTGNIRTQSELEPLGVLGDLGWYCVRFALWTLQWRLPENVSGRVLNAWRRPDSPEAVPMEFSGELFFSNEVTMSFYCSFLAEHQQWAYVSGTKGYLKVDDFTLPFFGSELGFEVSNSFYNVVGCDFNMEPRRRRYTVNEYSNSMPKSQETNMVRRFGGAVVAEEPEWNWGDMTLKTQQVLDGCLASSQANGQLIGMAKMD